VEVIEADRRFIKQAHKDVEVQAQKMLEQGMETQNQTQVTITLCFGEIRMMLCFIAC
jgi:hypothetical protein